MKLKLCLLLFLFCLILALSHGTAGAVWSVSWTSDFWNIIWSIRFPRVAVAALCGAAMASAGVFCQGWFRNPLASPALIGTTSGAALGAAIAFHFGFAWIGFLTLPIWAFTGAVAATFFVAIVAKAFHSNHTLILLGFAVNTLLSALTSLFLSLNLEDHHRAAALIHWLMGGFSGVSWDHLWIMSLALPLGLMGGAKLTPQLNVLTLGEDQSETLGISVHRLQLGVFIIVALLAGSAVSVAGAVPFVGLVVPHLTRILFGPCHKKLLWLSALNGMSLTLLADLVARTLRSPLEVEVGIVTSIIGAPYFIWLLWRSRN